MLASLSGFAVEVGPETPVSAPVGQQGQQNAAISRDSSRTLIAFEQKPVEGQLSRVVFHQYEANMGVALGRETFALQPSSRHQRRPAMGNNMLAWVEEDPGGNGASLTWTALGGYTVGTNFAPRDGRPERVGDVAMGTPIEVFHMHVFHVILWTAPDGLLKGVYRSLLARIGYNESVFDVTDEPAVNPSAGTPWNNTPALIAYNRPVPSGECASCPQRFSIRARTHGSHLDHFPFSGKATATAIDIAPAGAFAPRVVASATDVVVFWSMEEGGSYAQRVNTAGGLAVKIGGVRKLHDGTLHDASLGVDGEYYLAVQKGLRFAFVRVDRDLDLIESVPFAAHLAPGATISLGSDTRTGAMLSYAAQRPGETAPKAVFRVVGDNVAGQRRRSVR